MYCYCSYFVLVIFKITLVVPETCSLQAAEADLVPLCYLKFVPPPPPALKTQR